MRRNISCNRLKLPKMKQVPVHKAMNSLIGTTSVMWPFILAIGRNLKRLRLSLAHYVSKEGHGRHYIT